MPRPVSDIPINPVTLAQRIRVTRGELSQAEYAEKINRIKVLAEAPDSRVSQSMLSRYESGMELPSPFTLYRMALHAGVTVEWVLTGKSKNSGDAVTSDTKHPLSIVPRSEVMDAALLMEKKLRKHDRDRGPRGWKDDTPISLFDRVREEVREADYEIRRPLVHRTDDAKLIFELVDVMNFCMMIIDVLGGFEEEE